MIKVLKFGGTSLQDHDSRKNVVKIIQSFPNDRLVVVVSAMGRYPQPYATQTLQSLVSNHLQGSFYDRLIATGEIISSLVLLDELLQHDMKATALTSKQAGLKVKDKHLIDINGEYIRSLLEDYQVVIIPGFQGMNEKQEIELLESGDSDYSAVFIAKQLALLEVYIYSDVCGIYSGDPKFITSAKLIPHISYHQAMDLAGHKARIICLKALQEACTNSPFKIYLRSTFKDGCQTVIDHNDSMIRTMSIDFDYVLIQFEESIHLSDQPYLFELFNHQAMVKKEDLEKLQSDYTIIDDYTKVHFVGCDLEHDRIYLDFLNEFALCSKKETSSYYVKKKHDQRDIKWIHDIIVRED